MEQKKSPPPSQGHGGTSSTASSDANNAESLSNEANKTKTQLERALAYADRGWPVFPVYEMTDEKISWKKSKWNGARKCACGQMSCNSHNKGSRAGKHPRTEHGFDDATTDPEQITKWWTEWPNANIAITTGEVANLITLDIDVHNDDQNGFESIAEAEKELGPLPDTLTVRTGGGGEHRDYRYPRDGRTYGPRNGVLPGVDVRADGSYIIAPESNHKSGGIYELTNDLPVAELTQAWCDFIFKEPTPVAEDLDLETVPFREDVHEHLMTHSDRYPELWTGGGSGDNSADLWGFLRAIRDNSVAFGLKHGRMTPSDYKAHALAFYAERGATGTHPDSWFDAEVAKLMAEDTTPAPVAEDDNDDFETLPLFMTGAEYEVHPLRHNPPQALIPGLCWERLTTVFYRRDKHGKSTLARSVVAPFTHHSRVLWVGLEEDSEHLIGSLIEMGYFGPGFGFFTTPTADKEQVVEAVEAFQPSVIVVDTLHEWFDIHGVKDQNDPGSVGPHMRFFRTLARESGAAVLLLHHSVKDGDDYRGSTGIGGGADVVAHLVGGNGASGYYTVKPKGRIPASEARYFFDGHMYTYCGDQPTTTERVSKDEDQRKQVWKAIDTNPGCGKKKVRKQCAGIRAETVDMTVGWLIDAGYVENTGTDTRHAYKSVSQYPPTDTPPDTVGTRFGTRLEDTNVSGGKPNGTPHGHGTDTVRDTPQPTEGVPPHPSPKGRVGHPGRSRTRTQAVKKKKENYLGSLGCGDLDHDALKERKSREALKHDGGSPMGISADGYVDD